MSSERLIGLTGGIATGKSTVSCYLSDRYNLPILDADLYAREAVEKGSPILAEIFQRYGEKVKLPNEELSRQNLGEIIFNNPAEKAWLESLIHPYVRGRFKQAISQLKSDIIVLVIPLLFEAKMTDLITEIWVVYCSQEEQIKRLIQRDQLSQEEAINRIKSQWPIEKKKALADRVINNSFDLNHLKKQVDLALGNCHAV